MADSSKKTRKNKKHYNQEEIMSGFMSKRKYGLVILALMAFCFNLGAYSGSYEQGLSYLQKIKKTESSPGSERKRKDYLEKAYRAFKESTQKNARLFQVYIGNLLEKGNEIKSTAAQFVKEYPGYTSIINDLEGLTPNEKNELRQYMVDIEEQIPFIGDIKPTAYSLYPYQGDQPTINFFLNTQAAVQFNVDEYSEGSRLFPKGINTLGFTWRDPFIERNTLKLKLCATNDLTGYIKEKEIALDIALPGRLSYYDGEYHLAGEYFKSTEKTVTRRNGGTLLGGILLGALLGAAVYSVKEDMETGEILSTKERRKRGLLTGGITVGISLLLFITTTSKKTIPHRENIEYNRRLKEQIEELKKQIRVDFRNKDEE
jgi:hypothetical protein